MHFVCVIGDGGCGAYCVAFNFCSCLSLWIRWGFLCFVQLGQTEFFFFLADFPKATCK